MTLTGFQRFQVAKAWLKRGHAGDLQEYIKKVCEAKGLEYTPPKPRDRRA